MKRGDEKVVRRIKAGKRKRETECKGGNESNQKKKRKQKMDAKK